MGISKMRPLATKKLLNYYAELTIMSHLSNWLYQDESETKFLKKRIEIKLIWEHWKELSHKRVNLFKLQVEAAPVESPKAPATPPEDTQAFAKKPAKQKKPKVKKLGTSDIAAQISPDDLKAVLSDFEDKYSSDEHSQLQRVADYIIESFKDADIPFNKTVLEQPIKKVLHLTQLKSPLNQWQIIFITADVVAIHVDH